MKIFEMIASLSTFNIFFTFICSENSGYMNLTFTGFFHGSGPGSLLHTSSIVPKAHCQRKREKHYKVQNAGPLLTIHKTSWLVWLVFSTAEPNEPPNTCT